MSGTPRSPPAWFRMSAGGVDVEVGDNSPLIGILALQGQTETFWYRTQVSTPRHNRP